nr:hypothetical protein [Thermoanaerobacterales bacterium]
MSTGTITTLGATAPRSPARRPPRRRHGPGVRCRSSGSTRRRSAGRAGCRRRRRRSRPGWRSSPPRP